MARSSASHLVLKREPVNKKSRWCCGRRDRSIEEFSGSDITIYDVQKPKNRSKRGSVSSNRSKSRYNNHLAQEVYQARLSTCSGSPINTGNQSAFGVYNIAKPTTQNYDMYHNSVANGRVYKEATVMPQIPVNNSSYDIKTRGPGPVLNSGPLVSNKVQSVGPIIDQYNTHNGQYSTISGFQGMTLEPLSDNHTIGQSPLNQLVADNRRSTYTNNIPNITPQNGQTTPQNSYNTPQNSYNTLQNGYNTSQNGYNTSQNGYNTSQNIYNNNQNSYNVSPNNDKTQGYTNPYIYTTSKHTPTRSINQHNQAVFVSQQNNIHADPQPSPQSTDMYPGTSQYSPISTMTNPSTPCVDIHTSPKSVPIITINDSPISSVIRSNRDPHNLMSSLVKDKSRVRRVSFSDGHGVGTSDEGIFEKTKNDFFGLRGERMWFRK